MASTQHAAILSPLDQVMPPSHILIALVFPVKDHEAAILSLESGLEKTCTYLPYLKGRVVKHKNDRNQLSLTWDDNAPHPTIKEVPAPDGHPSYRDLINMGASSEMFPMSIMPTFKKSGGKEEEEGTEVFGATYTKIEGGIILGIAAHHNVMDGTGLAEMFRLWSTCARGGTVDAVPDPKEPLKRRERVEQALSKQSSVEVDEKPTLEDLLERHVEYKLGSLTPSNPSSTPSKLPPPPGSSKIFKFSVQKLAAVRASLSSVIPASHLTINNIVSALIWSHISHIRFSRSQQPEGAPQSRLGFAINGRKVLFPPSSTDEKDVPYVGNVNLLAQTALPPSEFTAASLSDHSSIKPIISAIASAVVKTNNTSHISSLIQFADAIPDLSTLLPGWNFFNGPDVSITSWANFDLYQMDFGAALGKLEVVRIPYIPLDGLVVILPRRRVAGSAEKQVEKSGDVDRPEVVEVTIMLREDDMQRLEESEDWKSWLADK